MARRLPPLIALRAFEAVGRLGSVRAAGEELAVSHTVVSRHVRNLEQRLGARLLRPAGRGLALTPEGQRYLAQIAQALDLIERATAELAAPRRRTLAIWCAPGVASRRVLPLLPELEALLPEHEITLLPTLARPDFAPATRPMPRSSIWRRRRRATGCGPSCCPARASSRWPAPPSAPATPMSRRRPTCCLCR